VAHRCPDDADLVHGDDAVSDLLTADLERVLITPLRSIVEARECLIVT
jgi:hypothetical protein